LKCCGRVASLIGHIGHCALLDVLEDEVLLLDFRDCSMLDMNGAHWYHFITIGFHVQSDNCLREQPILGSCRIAVEDVDTPHMYTCMAASPPVCVS